ncbi:DUF309 domain-containing protein [bacterium]|nr:DUF309 domain-containing protein [bacterium]MBU1957313.1 DUF309 domain-containing protein [bacterium]
MLKENLNLKEALHNYINLLHQEEYFNAHEVLEEAWHPLRKKNHPLKNLVKGLINGAICFEHLKRDRENSYKKASKVINSFERHKGLCVNGIEHFELFEEACFKVEALKKLHQL